MDARKQEEIKYHNAVAVDRANLSDDAFQEKYSNRKFYLTTKKSHDYVSELLNKLAPGKTALDYCCGRGGTSLKLANAGAEIYGIDISDESMRSAERLLADNGFGDRAHFQVMDAENTTFKDDMFDLIICSGVLHHLDIQKAFPELARILKRDGTIICVEALGYNPVINWYRRRTPQLRTAWEADHILTMSELRVARKSFAGAKVQFFHLFCIPAAFFHGTFLFKPILAFGNFLDAILLRVPFIGLLAWQMVFTLSAPRK